ncbi:M14 family metallopeptidase [Brevundimonas aveniformis]|uniref:M14 family metallopeptidase n=1 Tax=Brevundimonas aveniformis TaxID=370977 RepID=UPI00249129FC|nr:M14 family metallopeptidase [Brevundimonas aveniformis]
MFARFLIALALLLTPVPALAQSTVSDQLSGQNYDDSIPSPERVLGYAFGERLSRSADVLRYFEALVAAAPDRMILGRYGETWEGRPLPYAIIASPANLRRISAIREASVALTDPRRGATSVPADQPVIVWLMYSVHGNEISPAEASMATARHLLASRDPEVAEWLNNVVVVIVPTQNPDGRDRFMNRYYEALGLQPDPDGLSVERDEPWPNGRPNHYLFDLNRDWFAQTQPETRGQSALIRQWRPQVLVDAHEMGTDDPFFFPPEAEPLNPLLPEAQLRARHIFGRGNAAAFDREGVEYYTREVFDAFYPGYGDGWPSYLGAVGMTYEQGSARGLAARRSNGEILTYRTTVRNHFMASLATIRTASSNRAQLLNDFAAYYRTAVSEGGAGAWILARGDVDPGSADALAALLARQGIEVSRASAGFSACGRTYRAGDYIIRRGQPLGRLLQVLMDPSIVMRDGFVQAQEARRRHGLYAEVYDITAWALPGSYGVDAVECRSTPSVATAAVTADGLPGTITGAPDPVAYVVPSGSQAMGVLTRALRADIRVRSPEAAFTVGDRTFPAGSVVLVRAGSPDNFDALVADIADQAHAEIIGVPDTWVTEGPNLASDRSPLMPPVRVALAWDEPTDPQSAGAIRYVLEQRYGYPVSIVRTENLSRDLSRYQVLILPDAYGAYDAALATSLRQWVQRGGTLVGIGSGADLMMAGDNPMIASAREPLLSANGQPAPAPSTDPRIISGDADYAEAIRPAEATPDSVLGVLAQVEVDRQHWLSAGLLDRLTVLVVGSAIYEPLRQDEGTNVLRYVSARELPVAGHLWAENRAQLAFKPYVMANSVGRGQVIAFTQDPTFRGFLHGQDVLFLNAIFRGAAHSSPVR